MDVIKIGGAADVDVDAVCADVARIAATGRPLVVVHGGSADATRLGEELGHPPRFVTSPSGHTSRLTDRRTLEIYVMATAALNRRIVASLQAAGARAVGLSGLDGGLLRATRKDSIRVVEDGRVRIVRDDWTGRPVEVNRHLLETLVDASYLPVIAPLGLSERNEPLNVDGDRAAAMIAGRLRASVLALLTAVPGVLRAFPDESTLIRHVRRGALDEVLALAGGRMKKKVLGAREALDMGVRSVVIGASRGDAPVSAALAGAGTVFGAPLARTAEVTP
jgi:acetylglutamate/LysW-gamma-L-alpha-aminoadipate kinase